ncbi:Atxe2 family lasso peptide isopeptidase [Novosphingobium sp. RL4]|uniref:Atxe2 family lasso peptide isopeptidase n=1 Tax=Novosphingobium sp. RL4 TaxID=3109595 RepID=UPI002D796C38|nr:Atxe2 family lasso peptide isopeptidase [Novosphingobium sp. RL4]WRT94456.1 Atxe2 family lasso peptide isopeptidase [Novosphingobium sp. RL4]
MVSLFSGGLALAGAFVLSNPAHAACDDLLPTAADTQAKPRTITTMDLARLRDIGYPDATGDASSPYALSPDRTSIAFVISRGDPKSNQYCSALVVMPISGNGAARILDRGGAIPRMSAPFRNLYITTGFPELIVPIWSPDGKSIAYRKLIDGVVQLARARADGSGAQVATHETSNVEDFVWSADSARLIYFTRPGRQLAKDKIAREAPSGWLYDKSILPMQSWEPQPWASDLVRKSFVADLSSGAIRPASPEEEKAVTVPPSPGAPYEMSVTNEAGSMAWTAPVGTHPAADRKVWAQFPDGAKIPCKGEGCDGRISRLYWEKGGQSVVYLGLEGWDREEYVLHRWFPKTGRLTTILRTTDALTGCIFAGSELICGRENATTPRRIVGVNLASGRSRVIFDPNPEFAAFRLGRVTRLKFSSAAGLPAWGDLVLPPDYDGKGKLPLVIVQYQSRSFLRGGVGDDYPIFPMAAKGLAVLSFNRPPDVADSDPSVKTWEENRAASRRNWADRRSILSALEDGIDAAIATGVIDPERIGISGLSDGASTVEFALVNSRRFKAAAMSTCCDDLLTQTVLGGFAWGEENRRGGIPASVDNDREYWKPISLSINARKIDTPILMQVADREASLGLPAMGALVEADKPLEVFVFDDEYHNKWQPAHRLAIYDRDIDWFRFWLSDYRDPAPEKRGQYARWDILRAKAKSAVATTSP